jgi:hypothetical protein
LRARWLIRWLFTVGYSAMLLLCLCLVAALVFGFIAEFVLQLAHVPEFAKWGLGLMIGLLVIGTLSLFGSLALSVVADEDPL